MRLFAYHENAESVVSLLNALSDRVELHAFRAVSPTWYFKARRPLLAGFQWGGVSGLAHQDLVVVPGLRRFAGLSSLMLRRSYRSAVRRHGRPDFILLDSPYLEPWTDSLDVPLIYVATDPYRYYSWSRSRTAELERKLLARAQASFPVSELLAEEFRAAEAHLVVQLPNGVSTSFTELSRHEQPTPLDLASIPEPRVLTVGTINSTYDWPLIEALADARPQVSFVFVGPIREEDSSERRRIARTFGRPNVFSLGMKPYAELPSYLKAMDVLLNPLKVNDHNDRRFPLRLCEYLTTDRPILTTPIHEARAFAPHVVPVGDLDEALSALDAAIAGAIPIDRDGRREWLDRNSWDTRADDLISSLRTLGDGAATPRD